MEQYTALIRAITILKEAGWRILADAGSIGTPAFDLTMNAASYLEEQARVALRGE